MRAIYRYRAIDSRGRLKKGYIRAPNRQAALDILKERSLYPYELRKFMWGIKLFDKIPLKHIIIFCQQMYALIDSGIPLLQAIYTIYEDTHHRGLKKILSDVYMGLQRGNGLAMSFKPHNAILPEIFIDVLYAGEISGNLDKSFKYMADYYEKQYILRKKVTNALIYPTFVCILIAFLLQFLISYVTPYFAGMYIQSAQELPRSTQLLLRIHKVIGGKRLICSIIIIVTIITVLYKKHRYRFDIFILKVPILGNFLTKVIITKICTIMSILLRSGISMLESLQLTQNVINNEAVKSQLGEIKHSINQGQDILETFKSATFCTPIFIQILSAGMISGNIEQTFNMVARFYQNEIDGDTERFLTLIEPVLILLIGIAIGFISYALILPMYKMMEFI